VLRPVLVLAAVLMAAWLGAVQLASTAAYGDLAVRPSFPAALHDRTPNLLRPLLGNARARAAAAIHNGDLATAERLFATLSDDPETADLRGRVAEARGDRDAAVTSYVRAGDVVRAQNLIDALAQRDPARALADQERLVAALHDDQSAGEVTGQAWWRLGELQAAAGYGNGARREALWRAAQSSYERALALAPNEETYLLAAGYQSLANGDVAASERFYKHAADVVPNSADAYAGLAWTAAARNDCTRANTMLAKARALRGSPTPTTAPGPRDPTADPIVGPALKRCTP
jgi:tetratricopeptide (TPR) repeat protein